MNPLTLFRSAFAVLAISAATIVGVWGIQLAGYAPCELCLAQRWPYYVGVPLAALVTFASRNYTSRHLLRAGFIVLALVFVASAGLGTFHAGVEWGFWPGPLACTGSLPRPQTLEAFRQALDTVKVVACDRAALRVLGLSLAGWNVVVSVVLAIIAGRGAMQCGVRAVGDGATGYCSRTDTVSVAPTASTTDTLANPAPSGTQSL